MTGLVTQIFIAVAQVLYSGLTARLFLPSDFGALAVALGLQMLLTLLTTTGLPSLVLATRKLGRQALARIRMFGLIAGALAAALLLGVGPFVLPVLGVPTGDAYLPLLSLSLVIGPVAGIQSALLRRDGRVSVDALVTFGATLVSLAVAATLAWWLRSPWTLALGNLLIPALMAIVSTGLHRARRGDDDNSGAISILPYIWRVTGQNVGFFLVGQVPVWASSTLLGAAPVGVFSRAQTMTQMPGNAVANALVRALHGQWRHAPDPLRLQAARRDAVTISVDLAFPLFAVMAGMASPLVHLWLGGGGRVRLNSSRGSRSQPRRVRHSWCSRAVMS